MTPAGDLAAEDRKASAAPVLTWIGVAMALLFVIPSVLILKRMAEPDGGIVRLAGFAFYASPVAGYLLITLAG